MKIAKVRHRIMASLLDFIIVAGISFLFVLVKLPFLISFLQSYEHVVTTKFIVDIFRWGIIFTAFFLAYYSVVPTFLKGQTIGKKVFKLKIVKEDGSDVDYKTMLYREGIGRIFINVASLGMTLIADIVIMNLRKDNKNIKDILAKTKVIDLYEMEE